MILRDCKLLDRIVEAHLGNEEDLRKKSGRRGYMGALTQISCTVVNNAVKNEIVGTMIKDHSEWNAYVLGPLSAVCELQDSPNECYQPPKREASANTLDRDLMKARCLTNPRRTTNSTVPATRARPSEAVAQAVRKAREEKRRRFRRGGRHGSSFPEVEILVAPSKGSHSKPSGHAEQAKNERPQSCKDELLCPSAQENEPDRDTFEKENLVNCNNNNPYED